ncbi:hypothetical protein ACFSHQ_12285 [Gemmobacter lanyuensis]
MIIGYDALGDPVRATATAEGVMVSESTASGLASGLAAGLYPPGSALYSVPPGGQLSCSRRHRISAIWPLRPNLS